MTLKATIFISFVLSSGCKRRIQEYNGALKKELVIVCCVGKSHKQNGLGKTISTLVFQNNIIFRIFRIKIHTTHPKFSLFQQNKKDINNFNIRSFIPN